MVYFSEIVEREQARIVLDGVFASQALFWCCCSLCVLLASLWKLERDRLSGYSVLFWFAIAIALVLEIAAWSVWVHDVVSDNGVQSVRSDRPAHQYLIAMSLSLFQFGFSIVNLSLSSLGSMLQFKSHTRERLWLTLNFTQVTITMMLTTLQLKKGVHAQIGYWSIIYNCFLQIINMGVFIYWYISLRNGLKGNPMSRDTARVYSRVLSRFVEYLCVYAVYTIIFILATMATIADVCDAFNTSWMIVAMASQPAYYACRYFLLWAVVYIFQPAWIRAIERSIVNSIDIIPGTSVGGLTVTAASNGSDNIESLNRVRTSKLASGATRNPSMSVCDVDARRMWAVRYKRKRPTAGTNDGDASRLQAPPKEA